MHAAGVLSEMPIKAGEYFKKSWTDAQVNQFHFLLFMGLWKMLSVNYRQ